MVRTRYFALEGRVDFAGTGLPYSALLEAAPNGALVTTARRWTPAERTPRRPSSRAPALDVLAELELPGGGRLAARVAGRPV
jgi:hypothetical protein